MMAFIYLYKLGPLATSAATIPRMNKSDPYSDQVTPVGSPRHAMLSQAIHQVFSGKDKAGIFIYIYI
jgi:hypothetical protein